MLAWTWGEGTLIHWWLECKLTKPFWAIIWVLFNKLETKFPYEAVTSLLGI